MSVNFVFSIFFLVCRELSDNYGGRRSNLDCLQHHSDADKLNSNRIQQTFTLVH